MTRLPALRHSAMVVAVLGLVAGSLEAQTDSATLHGAVIDSMRQPVAEVAVYVEGTSIAGRTDLAGRFRLSGLTIGTYTLSLRKKGFAGRSFRVVLSETEMGDQDLGSITLQPGPDPVATLTGSVSDAVTGRRLVGVGVAINGWVAGTTNRDGVFRIEDLNMEWGANLFEVRRIGYQPQTDQLTISLDTTDFHFDVELTPLPIEVAEVVVDGDHIVYAFGRMREFYKRRRIGIGHYFTPWEIKERQPRLITDLLGLVPGVQISPGFDGLNNVSVSRCGTPTFYLDGLRLRAEDSDIDSFILPDHVAGVEVYTRGSQTPAAFSGGVTQCGVVAIWTQ